MTTKKWAILLGALAIAAAPAVAASATTQINMKMPSMVILYHRGSVTFDIPEAALATWLAGGPVVNEGPLVPDLADFTGDAALTATPFNDPSTLTASVANFWAVRSIGGAGAMTDVSVSVGGATLTHATEPDTIVIANPLTDTAGGSPSSSNVSFPPTGLGSFQLGDVQFTVDLSNVTTAGSYSGGSIVITAVNM